LRANFSGRGAGLLRVVPLLREEDLLQVHLGLPRHVALVGLVKGPHLLRGDGDAAPDFAALHELRDVHEDHLLPELLEGHALLFEGLGEVRLGGQFVLLHEHLELVVHDEVHLVQLAGLLHEEELLLHLLEKPLGDFFEPYLDVGPLVLPLEAFQGALEPLLELALGDDGVVDLEDDLFEDGTPGGKAEEGDGGEEGGEGALHGVSFS